MAKKQASPTRFVYKIGLNTAKELAASVMANESEQTQKPYRLIFMNRDKVALVDEEDYERVNQHKWYWGCSHRYAVYFESRDGWRKSHTMHRFIMNPPKDMVVDHINHNRLDNRRSNLRVCTRSQNSRNVPRGSRNASGYIGVFWNKNRAGGGAWESHIRIGEATKNNKHTVGHYSTPQYAALARDQEALIHHGEFAVLNFGEWNE
jgi:hypothetical protein